MVYSLWTSIQRLLMERQHLFQESFEEKVYKHVGMAWCVHSLLKELPEDGGNQGPKTGAIQLPWLRQQRQFQTL